MKEHERKLRMTASQGTAVVMILTEVLSRLAQLGPRFEAAVREGLETAAENLAIEARRPAEPPLPLDYGHAFRVTRLMSQAALLQCDLRAGSARGEIVWPSRRDGDWRRPRRSAQDGWK